MRTSALFGAIKLRILFKCMVCPHGQGVEGASADKEGGESNLRNFRRTSFMGGAINETLCTVDNTLQ